MAILISPILAEANSSLKNIPEGFEDFFSDKATSVKLRNLDGSFSDPMTFIANFKSVKIPVEFDQQQIIDFLQANQIDSVYHGEILSLFRQGFSNQSLCKGYLPECELQPEKYELVYNASTKEIYLFVNQTILDFSNSKNANAFRTAGFFGALSSLQLITGLLLLHSGFASSQEDSQDVTKLCFILRS